MVKQTVNGEVQLDYGPLGYCVELRAPAAVAHFGVAIQV
jgi:hypothetical protein